MHVLGSLTGLRFVAAFLVFGRHALPLFAGTPVAGVASFVLLPASAGVSFFFVLSGFVLAWCHRSESSPRSFYRRRFARIFPNHAVTLVAAAFVIAYEGSRVQLSDVLASLTLVQAWVPRESVYLSMNSVSWSLSCEAFFYALFPLLVVVLLRRGSAAVGAVVGVMLGLTVAAAVLATELSRARAEWLVNYCPAARLSEFVAGIALAILVGRGRFPRIPWRGAIVLAVVAYGVAAVAERYAHVAATLGGPSAGRLTAYLAYVALPFAGFAVLIPAAAYADIAGLRTLVSRRWAIRLGEWSFAFYLIHYLVFRVFQQVAPARHGLFAACAYTVLLLMLSTALAGALHLLFERPLERRIRQGDGRATVAAPRVRAASPVS